MGYIGFTSSVFMAQKIPVICVESDQEKLGILLNGEAPFYEPGLYDAFKTSSYNLQFTSDQEDAIIRTDISFITVGTPSLANGEQDTTSLRTVLSHIGGALRKKKNPHTIIIKSTVLPGTTMSQIIPLLEESSGKNHGKEFNVLVNPEFTREGQALQDITSPDKIVIGAQSQPQTEPLISLYNILYPQDIPTIITSYTNAELIKYAQNAFLATKLSFINTVANLCETIPEADIDVISKSIGLDPRISPLYLRAGLGYGGSCLPKDLLALEYLTARSNVDGKLFAAVREINEAQPFRAVEIAEKALGSLQGKVVSLLGLSFKPETDDVRESPALEIIQALLSKGAKVKAYDPKAAENARKVLGDSIEYSSTVDACLDLSDCCIIATDWSEFRSLGGIQRMNRPLVIDGRNVLAEKPDDVEYHRIGLGPHIR